MQLVQMLPKLRMKNLYMWMVNGSEWANMICDVWCVLNMCVRLCIVFKSNLQIVYSWLNIECSCWTWFSHVLQIADDFLMWIAYRLCHVWIDIRFLIYTFFIQFPVAVMPHIEDIEAKCIWPSIANKIIIDHTLVTGPIRNVVKRQNPKEAKHKKKYSL